MVGGQGEIELKKTRYLFQFIKYTVLIAGLP